MKIAISAISDFLLENDMLVYLIANEQNSLFISKQLSNSIEEYNNYLCIKECNNDNYEGKIPVVSVNHRNF